MVEVFKEELTESLEEIQKNTTQQAKKIKKTVKTNLKT